MRKGGVEVKRMKPRARKIARPPLGLSVLLMS